MGTDRMMEVKKGSRAAGIGKGSAPKKRSNRADETDQDWSTSKIKLKQKQGWDKCLQKPLIHDANLILEISLFVSWSSKPPGKQCICMNLVPNPGSALRSWSCKPAGLQYICMYLHDFGAKPRFSFEILILQTRWFTVNLHDWCQIHIDFAKRWTFSITCWYFHNFVAAGILGPNSILKVSLFGSWSSTLPGLECFCMILELNPDSVLGSLSSKPPGLQWICMIFGLNLDSAFRPWSPKMRHVYKSLSFTMQMRFRKSHFSDPDRPNHLVNSVHVFAWIWDQTQAQFWDPDRPNHLVYSVFACICMILVPNPGSALRSWSSKPAGLQWICMILVPNPHWFYQKVNI